MKHVDEYECGFSDGVQLAIEAVIDELEAPVDYSSILEKLSQKQEAGSKEQLKGKR